MTHIKPPIACLELALNHAIEANAWTERALRGIQASNGQKGSVLVPMGEVTGALLAGDELIKLLVLARNAHRPK